MKMMEDYYSKGPQEHNLIKQFINEEQPQLTKDEIFAEAHTMLLAGTETTSNALGFTFYLLLKNPACLMKLIRELEILDKNSLLEGKVKVEYLDAVIKESFRLLPPVAGTLMRMTPDQGMAIMGHYIPLGVSRK